MSLIDLGKNDISEETQTLKDRLASRDTESAGLRTQLMRREAELEELRAAFNETVYKLSKEADRALQLEEEVSARSSELKTDRISLRNTELALQSAQENIKAQERANRELESTLDTLSLHSQTTSAQHQSVQREKRALESRVRELERIVQTHEARGVSNIPRKNGRPRSSSFQLHTKDMNLRVLEQKLAQAQDDLVKAENARISIDKAGQKRISELLASLEGKEEELESLRDMDNTGEREEELLKRIDEDAAKIAALEKLAAESQPTRTSQTRIQKLQSQLKAECEKVHRSEDLQNRLLHEKEALRREYEASKREIDEGRELLMARERQIKELETRYAHLLDTHGRCKEPLSLDAEHTLSQRPNSAPAFANESALADHIQTLLQAIDRLRDERDGLKRALEFSEVEYRITTEGFQSHIASLTRHLTGSTYEIATDKPPTNSCVEQRMKQLTSCAAAFTVVISNLQTHLDLSEDRLSATSADLASSNSQLHDALAVIDNQKQLLGTNAQSDGECGRLRLQLADVEGQVATVVERAKASEDAREEALQSFLLAEQHLATLNKNCQDIESERNSLVLQVTNLQDDLARVQDEVSDAKNRYDTLHAQQLSAMSTSEVVQALKDRIQELEACIVHHTDQIGEYQHDIRRLEANVKLHEERIAEMMTELELLASQKDAMVEDCAEAREARDDAIERLEAAEEEAERLQQEFQWEKHTHDAELSAMSSMVANLKSENQQTTARLADLEAENAEFIRELDSVTHDHQRLNEQLNAVASRSRSLELENSKENAEMQQAVISLAVIYRVYKDSARRSQRSHQRITSLESQLVTLSQELEQKGALIDSAEKEKHDLLQRLADISTATDQDEQTSFFRLQTTAEELSSMCTAAQQQEAQQDDHGVDFLRNSLQEREQELVTARRLLEGTKSRYAEVETELLERIATITVELQAQEGQAEDIADLRVELENVKTQLKNSLENFSDLEKLHGDVIQDFTTAKEVFERRLIETDEQICTLEADHQHTLVTVEARYRHEVDFLASNLEDREHEVDELRQQVHDISEARTRAEGNLHEELKSYEVRHALKDDLEKDLRRTISDMRQRLAQADAETLALQEERELLQVQITDLQAEIQRLTSLTRYMESQVRESEDACMLLKENLERSELSLAESEKAGKAAEFNLTLQTTQHEKVVAILRREIASLQSGPELRSALADLEEKSREMDDLLRVKCQEIEEYDDRILGTLKANKKLTSKVESLTRKVQALQAKLSSMKKQPRETVEVTPPQKASSTASPSIPAPAAMYVGSCFSSSHIRESSAPSLTLRSKTPEPRLQPVVTLPSVQTPGRTSEPSGCEMPAGKKRPAPDDDERDSVPAEGHYSTDGCLRNGPTPRLRRAHGHPTGFTPVRGASRKPAMLPSPGRRLNAGITPSEVITDVTNSPRGPSGQGDAQLKKRSWLGKIRGGAGSQPASSRLGALGGQ
ncbi:hypothetical protein J3R82DRAFT_528 [Butyriboletus roseoflavus]|nr:hypothetical protein J3R82DRAFT_528 [Butyriboletus roseoflavus]